MQTKLISSVCHELLTYFCLPLRKCTENISVTRLVRSGSCVKKREITTAVQKVHESFIADLTVAMKDQLDYKPTSRGRGITIRKFSQTSKAILSVARIQGNAIHFCGFQGEN